MTTQGFSVEREPLIEKGQSFCQRVELATVEMVDALLVLEKIPVMGKHITIKKYNCDHGRIKPRRKPGQAWNTLKTAVTTNAWKTVGKNGKVKAIE